MAAEHPDPFVYAHHAQMTLSGRLDQGCLGVKAPSVVGEERVDAAVVGGD
jgi:hypothetical protein